MSNNQEKPQEEAMKRDEVGQLRDLVKALEQQIELLNQDNNMLRDRIDAMIKSGKVESQPVAVLNNQGPGGKFKLTKF